MQYLRFRFVEDRLGVASKRVVRRFGDLARRRGELAQDRAIANDLGVMPNVGGSRDVLYERAQVCEPADVIELLRRRQRFRERHDVRWLAVSNELHHMTIDDAMRVAIEVGG